MDTSFLRQANIFGNQTPRDPYQGVFGNGMESPEINTTPLRQANFGSRPISPQEITSEPDDFAGYTPEHTATDRYNQLVGQYPAQDHPGILRRIAAMAAGFGGPNPAQEQILHGGRNRAVEDWKTQIGPAEQAANLERYSNANERQTQYNIGQLRASNRRLDVTEAHNKQTEEAARLRNEAYQFRTLHPNHKIEQYGDGFVRAVDPQTNEVTNLGKWAMSDADKLNLGQQNALERIGAQGNQARQTRGTIPGGSKALAALPSQAVKARLLAAKQLAEDFPAYADYVQVDPTTGDVSITAPSGPSTLNKVTGGYLGSESSGPSEAEYRHMVATLKEYEGKYAVPFEGKSNTSEAKTIPPGAVVQKNKKTGQVRFSIDGGKTWQIQ